MSWTGKFLGRTLVRLLKFISKGSVMLEKYFSISKDKLALDIKSIQNLKRFYFDSMEIETKNMYSVSTADSTNKWTGSTVEEFKEILNSGDVAMIKSIKDFTDKKTSELLKSHNKLAVDYLIGVEGEFFDVGIVLSGEPEHWFKETKIDGATIQPRIKINISGSYSHKVNANTVLENASLILAYCKVLERLGIQTSIKVHFQSSNEHERRGKNNVYDYFLKVKGFEDNISYYKLSTVLHPSFLRRGIFRIKEIRWNKNQANNYGKSQEDEKFIQLNDINSIAKSFEKFFE